MYSYSARSTRSGVLVTIILWRKSSWAFLVQKKIRVEVSIMIVVEELWSVCLMAISPPLSVSLMKKIVQLASYESSVSFTQLS